MSRSGTIHAELNPTGDAVAELKVYAGGENVTEGTTPLWSGQGTEGFKKLPATKVAEEFREFVLKLSPAPSGLL